MICLAAAIVAAALPPDGEEEKVLRCKHTPCACVREQVVGRRSYQVSVSPQGPERSVDRKSVYKQASAAAATWLHTFTVLVTKRYKL